MEKQKIAIDLDTTLNNLNDVWLNLYNKEYNDNLKDFKEWDVSKCVKKKCGKKIFDYLKLPHFFYNLDIRSNAFETINFLKEYYDLYIVTAYIPETCLDKVNWIKEKLPIINPENIIFCNDKSLLNFDYLIDDGPHNIETFKGKGILYNMSYNEYLGNDLCYDKVNNWIDIKNLFEGELFYNNNKEFDIMLAEKAIDFHGYIVKKSKINKY